MRRRGLATRRENQWIGGPCGNPGDSPGFMPILPHGSVLNLSVIGPLLKALLLCESELSVDQRITGPWRGRRARYGTRVLCGSAWWLCEPPLVRPAPQGTALHGALPVTCCCLAAGVTRHRDPEQGDPAPGPGSPAAPCRGGVGTEGFRCGDGSESSRVMRKVCFTSIVGGGHTAVTTPSWGIALSVRHPWSKYLLGDSGPGGSPSFSS